MTRIIDLTGQKFNHLTVLGNDGTRTKSGAIKWLCQCDCGKQTHVQAKFLKNGDIKSCGHVLRERARRLSQSQLDKMPGTRLAQLNDKPQKDNKTGHKNISIDVRNGTTWYRVSVTFKGVRHQTRRHTLEEAIEAREALREKYWPNYKK